MSSAWRRVRVFVSSLFDDMHAEREHLIRVVFPALRAQLLSYRVELLDVDLRWGVSRQQAENERVLALALDQIDECRPFFIGLIGGRYGWVPAQYPEELRKKFDWITPQPLRSSTDLELTHGALNDNAWMTRALFCFRDPAGYESIPEPIRRAVYVETSAALRRRLLDLHQRIEGCGYPRETYSCRWDGQAWERATRSRGRLVDLEDFGQRVSNWLWFAIRAELKLLAPVEPSRPEDFLADEADAHLRYREACRVHHIARNSLNQQLHAYALSEEDSHCLVTGPAGCGKSSALAHFVRTFRLQHPKTFIVGHFVGASPHSLGLRDLLGRLCEELKQRLRLALPIPPGTAERLSVFLGLLLGVPARARVILVLDGLERLDPDHDAHTLHWLPDRLRAHVKIIASCQDEPAARHPVMTAFMGRKCRLLPVEPFSAEEKRQLIGIFPRLPARSLGPEEVEQLVQHPATGNPLFLTVALEELRAGSAGLTPADWLARLPPAGEDALPLLFEQVLGRLEEEFDHELVPTTLALLVCARRGLSEHELRDLTTDCQLHDQLFLLLRWLRPYLYNRAGQLELIHPVFRQVVERQYLKRDALQTGQLSQEESGIRTRLAHYFGSHHLDERQLEEVPWHLAEMRAWPTLVELLSDLPFLQALYHLNEYDVKNYWTQIRTGSALRLPDAYRAVVENPAGHDEHVPLIAGLLQSAGNLDEALVLREYQGEGYRKLGDQAKFAGSLANQATIRIARGDLEGAMKVLKQQEEICRLINDPASLKTCLGSQAVVLRKRGELAGALALHKQEEQLCRQMNSSHGVALSLINQAHLLADKMKQPAEALPLAEEAYRLATRHGFNNLASQIKARLLRIRQKAANPEQTKQGDPSSRFLNLPESGIG